MPGENIERIDSLPTKEELGIEKIPVKQSLNPKLRPRVVAISPLEGIVVTELPPHD